MNDLAQEKGRVRWERRAFMPYVDLKCLPTPHHVKRVCQQDKWMSIDLLQCRSNPTFLGKRWLRKEVSCGAAPSPQKGSY